MGVAGECALQETRIGGRFKTSHRAGPAPARMTTREPLAVLYDSRFCTTATSAFALRSCVLRLFLLPPFYSPPSFPPCFRLTIFCSMGLACGLPLRQQLSRWPSCQHTLDDLGQSRLL